MKIKVFLSIGYPTAKQEDELEIDDSELEGLTADQREDYINELVNEWANQFVEAWYEEDEE